METSTEFSEETRDSRYEEVLRLRNNTEDHLGSTEEQLAELHLLARADLLSPTSSFTMHSVETSEGSSMEDGEVGVYDRPEAVAGGLSSFSAILGASRKLAATATHRAHMNTPALGTIAPIFPLDQTHQPLAVEVSECSSPTRKILPTLTEEAEEDDDDEIEDTPARASISTAPTLAEKLSSLRTETIPESQHQEPPEEPDVDDAEFVEMLEHLSRGKLDFLVLTAEDLALRKLERVHAALQSSQPSPPEMAYVRALVSVDMLRLLLRRVGVQTIRDAVHRATRQMGEREETAGPAALTNSNIAAVVLEVRRELTVEGSNERPPPPHRTTAAVSNHHVRRASNTSTRSSSSSVSSSPRCRTPRSPAADRRSILAKEGAHVLMQEKLASFDHRGQVNPSPAFRVRGASASTTDSASKRRQRGLQYAHDHVSHRTVHM